MTAFLVYELKVAVLIAVFYFCYRLLMERDTTHRLNRIVLLSSILLSLFLPLCVITLHKTVEIEQTDMVDSPALTSTDLGTISTGDANNTIFQPSLIFAILIIGLVFRLLYIANSYRQLLRMIRKSELHPLEDGMTVAVVDQPVAPFSWMHTIVLSRSDYTDCNPSILAHERGHILQHHSWDIVFVEALTALQWFNPMVWLLRHDLRTIHEYEADASVLSSGSDMRQYMHLLLQKATQTQGHVLANGINNSTIKKRIMMMIRTKSPRRNLIKILVFLPIVGVTLVLNAKTVNNHVYIGEGFALHAVTDNYGRIIGFSTEGKPITDVLSHTRSQSAVQSLEFPIGYIFIDNREATTEEAIDYKSLDILSYEIIRRPDGNGTAKWNYKDKHGILVFHLRSSPVTAPQ